jgi:hypothetical protein
MYSRLTIAVVGLTILCFFAVLLQMKMLRCGSCGCTYYCSAACQKSDWKLGHKGVCKELGAWRTQAAAAAASNGNGNSS